MESMSRLQKETCKSSGPFLLKVHSMEITGFGVGASQNEQRTTSPTWPTEKNSLQEA
ncbi:hypothetical protein CCACVL1_21634 [Corchorus capsularis]|uniref:Uncharacterized protein n=1 Tax=Corchorus capsularis TaxID=210143 RepID=A0A1R3H2N2_COCAP|nr:hypothetical protein CCACVL1_21634 [Corchorus capsularis]